MEGILILMQKNVIVNWLIEFGPILVFFFVFEFMRFVPATAVFVAATILALSAGYMRNGRLALFPAIAGFFVILFGSATVIFNDPLYLIVRDTLYHGVLGLILLWGFITNRLPLKHLFRSLFLITDDGWKRVSFQWMVFFFAVTVSNEYVWRTMSEAHWVHFKFGVTIATMLFVVAQIPTARKNRLPESNKWGMNMHH